MKTAANLRVAALSAMLGTGALLGAGFTASPVLAQALAANPIETSIPGPSSMPEISEPSIVLSEPSVEKPVVAQPKKAKKPTYPTMNTGNDDTPDSVRNVISRLTTETENVTLEDLNAAREAVVKLDVLIDIEKRLGDLEKLRQMRQGSSSNGISSMMPVGVIPSSTPTLPSMGASDFAVPSSLMGGGASINEYVPPKQSRSGPMSGDVLRVSGADGSYSASIVDSSGRSKTVREGSKLSDGTLVSFISRDGVTLVKGDEKKTVQVKDVNKVFSKR